MTGRELYDALVMAWAQNQRFSEGGHPQSGNFLQGRAWAWPYLEDQEIATFEEAARQLSKQAES